MKRFLIFVLCGPAIGLLVALLEMIITALRLQLEMSGLLSMLASDISFLLPSAYLFGLPCALAAWGVDAIAARTPFLWRLAGTVLTGALVSAIMDMILPGLVAAAACSTLAWIADGRRVATSGNTVEPQ
jgi:hypothetical protein